jgi:hypothetical protein
MPRASAIGYPRLVLPLWGNGHIEMLIAAPVAEHIVVAVEQRGLRGSASLEEASDGAVNAGAVSATSSVHIRATTIAKTEQTSHYRL